MPTPPRIQPISKWADRRLFNERGFWERTETGELTTRLRRNSHPSPPLAHEPFCTRSQMVSYHDTSGMKVAIVHQYVRPSGELGLGGKPDPKWLMVDGVVYEVLD